jgi:fructan beta-fructosidase
LFLLKDDAGRERWVFTAAKGFYSVGDFNGEKFVSETAIRRFDLGANSYAAQTWSNAPDRRCIQIAWMPGGLYPEMPFNQQLSIPVQLSLVGSGKNTSLYRWPVEELNRLRKNKLSVTRHTIAHGKPLIPETDAQLFDLSFTVHKLDAAALYLMIRGRPVILDWRSNTLTFEPSGINKVVGDRPQVELPSGTALDVRVLIDKTSLEFFFNGGQISASFCFLPDGYINPVVLNSFNGEQVIENLELYELQSSWRAS